MDEYADRMGATSSVRYGQIYWGDHLTLVAATEVFECTITVYSSLDSWKTPKIFKPLQAETATTRHLIIAHLYEFHYMSC
eukprot:gene5388-18152_t